MLIPSLLPKIYYVNWFRKNADGQFLWPGFGENSRVLKWIFERIDHKASAKLTPIGYLPEIESIDLSHLDISQEDLNTLLSVDKHEWLDEVESIRLYYQTLGIKAS